MRKIIIILLYFIGVVNSITFGQIINHRTYTPFVVDSVKVWRNGFTLDKLQYKSYNARLIKRLDEFSVLDKPMTTKYGSDPRRQYKATGFFRTQKIDGRWWIIDPDGYPQIARYINGVRPGKSDRQKAAFGEKYGNNERWMSGVCDMFENLGFNGFGAWSDQDLVLANDAKTDYAMPVTLELGMASSFKQRVNNVAPFFDPEFPAHCEQRAKVLVSKYKNEKNFFGYFTDNELPFRQSNLDSYLGITDKQDPNRIAAEKWLADRGKTKDQINDADRLDFVGYVVSTYYAIVTTAIRKYDPNHMILGSRIVSYAKYIPTLLQAHNKYCDICSINDYETWEQTDEQLKIWEDNLKIPFMATEFYAKAEDSGLPNKDGGGNWVKTQTDRAYFYQTFCLKLLESKSCVGWHWFRYMDNDPDYKYNSFFDTDANKGIVNSDYNLYQPLGQYMKELNRNVYRLVDYFDRTNEVSGNINLEPVADTFFSKSSTDNTVNGVVKRLMCSENQNGNYQYESLLKFNLVNYKPALSNYGKILLKIYCSRSADKTIEIHGLLNDDWNESMMTGKDFLADSNLFQDNLIGTIKLQQNKKCYYEVDVTNFIKKSLINSPIKQLTFRLCDQPTGKNSVIAEFNSKEADDNHPVLELIPSGKADMDIASLKINGVTYPEFTNYEHDYDIKLPYTTKEIPQISVRPSIPGSIVSVIQAVSLNGDVEERTATVTLKDKSENPHEMKTYRFTFEILPKLDLFLLIGQSNMAGRGKLDNGYPFSPHEDIFILNDFNSFEKAENPLNKYSDIRKNYAQQGLGPGYSFARRYLEYTGNKTDIGLIVNARGGSSIAQWQKGNSTGLYVKTIARVREAQKWGDIRAILWHQGESDMKNKQYGTELKNLADSLRNDVGSNVLFVAGEIAQWQLNAVNFNQNIPNITASIGNATYVSSNGLTPLIDNSDPHFNATSQIELGKRYAQAVCRKLNIKMNFGNVSNENFTTDYRFDAVDIVSWNPKGLDFSNFSTTGVIKNYTSESFSVKGWDESWYYDAGKYITFTIKPQESYEFTLKGISFDINNYSDNGPTDFEIRSSMDDYKTKLIAGNISTKSEKYKILLDGKFESVKQPVTFRIYAYGAKSTNASLFIDNVEISGRLKRF